MILFQYSISIHHALTSFWTVLLSDGALGDAYDVYLPGL